MSEQHHLHLGQKPAPGDLALIQGLVNTLDVESGRDDLATPDAATAWLRSHGLLPDGGRLAAAEQRKLRGFREALRARLLENNGAGDESGAENGLERFLEGRALRLALGGDGRLELLPGSAGVDGAIERLLAIAHRAMIEGTWQRLKACREDTCQWAFYDSSKNRSGAWCSMESCGNRAKVRKHRARSSGSVSD